MCTYNKTYDIFIQSQIYLGKEKKKKTVENMSGNKYDK